MRKIKAYFFISLDGVVESPDQWHFPYFDDQMGDAVGAGFAGVGAYVMGRVLYEEWAAYWPEHVDEPFGDVLNATKKYVLSGTLTSVEWQNSEILGDDAASRLTELKAEDGGDLVMSGSATTARWLLGEGLLDELHLFIHPIVVGGDMARLFPADVPQLPLQLLSSETFATGVVYAVYAPRVRDPGEPASKRSSTQNSKARSGGLEPPTS
jgi:dihydrofolate reductase